MTEYEPYSVRRRKAERAGQPTVYQYDAIPLQMRVQVFYAMRSTLGHFDSHLTLNRRSGLYEYSLLTKVWVESEQIIREEHGYIDMPHGGQDAENTIREYLLAEANVELVLDAIEIVFRTMQEIIPPVDNPELTYYVSESIAQLNSRFRQHDLGYEFVGTPGVIIRADSQFVHAEVVEPAIALLHGTGFQGPLDEFLKAHREYRRGDNKDAMNDALKAFESTMKAICDALGWPRDPKWTAAPLIKAMFDNGLIPASLESYFGGIRSILESGVPTLRNKQSGHGQGPAVTDVPDYLAAFTLHLTAANIVFLMSAFKALP